MPRRCASITCVRFLVALALVASACSLGGGEVPGEGEVLSLSWERITSEDLGGAGRQAARSVVAGHVGLVAVGLESIGGDSDAAVWTSADGHTWNRHRRDVFADPGDQFMSAIAWSGDLYVAVGADSSGGDLDAAVWTSPDGLVWERTFHDGLGGSGDQEMRAVVAGESGFIAAGSDGSKSGPAVWHSDDGQMWQRIESGLREQTGSHTILDLAISQSGLVAVGFERSGSDADSAVWISSDGLHWTRVVHDEEILGGESDQIMRAIAITGSGFVAVGEDASRGDLDAALWTSEDGETWMRVAHDAAVLGGDGYQSAWAVVVGDRFLLALGVDSPDADQDGAAWVSDDRLTWRRVPDRGALTGPGLEALYEAVAYGDSVVVVGLIIERSEQDAAVWVVDRR